MSDLDQDDDEEILQLQLQAIQAKLRLKKLQRQKSSQNANDGDSRSNSESSNSPRKRQKTHAAAFDPAIQIPVSPIKDRMPPPPPEQTSPARVLLGIDKGLRAADVSLKRARSGSTLPNKTASRSGLPAQAERPKQSFSERIAANRLSSEQQQAKQERIEKARSQGFGLGAIDKPHQSRESAQPRPQLSRTQSDRTTRHLPGQSSVSSFSRSIPASSATTSPFVSTSSSSAQASGRSFRPADKYTYDASTETASTDPSSDGSCFESFSALHLSRRNIPHTKLARAFDGKQVYPLPRLLKEVKAPTYEPPDCESDFVVLAVIASKSSPYDTRPKYKQTTSAPEDDDESCGRTKFMVMKLTDLKWEVDLFLFDTAFEAFWKMTPGTVVAILNPTIMPPKTNRDSGQFSLKLASSEDSVMEIGSARDLGFCAALKKNGQECGSWVNARKNKFCDFHVELAVNKTRASRMEVNTMYRPNGQYQKGSRALREGEFARRQDTMGKDYESGERYFMVPGARTTASLLDADDFGKQDAMRRRLKEKEKDRQLAEKLAQMGNGIGAEYLQRTTGTHASNKTNSTNDPDLPPPKLSAAELGLINKNAADVHLSPVRGRRKLFSVLPGGSKTTAAGPEAMGWGNAGKRGLDSQSRKRALTSPERGQTKLDAHKYTLSVASSMAGPSTAAAEKSPKKARFQLAKGIREPGRESLGDKIVEDDSDDLEIY